MQKHRNHKKLNNDLQVILRLTGWKSKKDYQIQLINLELKKKLVRQN